MTRPILAAAGDAKPVAGVDRDFEIQVVEAISKQPIAGAEVTINFIVQGDAKLPDGVHTRREVTEDKGRAW